MNVEFLIHGTLSDGQSSWKEIDSDYCARFYTQTSTNVLMACEVLKREKGEICSYYSYLRYNNLSASSGRSGSYFGITVRIDGFVCCDVANMYYILNTIFNKCIVGTLLTEKNNSYVYTCDSFKSKDTELKAIEAKFGNMYSLTFISENDFVVIPDSYNRKSGVLNLNIEDITNANAKETLLAGNKLCVSPFFPSKQSQNAQSQIQTIQEECAMQIQAKTQELEQANHAANTGKVQLKEEVSDLQQQLKDKEHELKEVKAQIKQTAKGLQEQITKLTAIMAERFPEDDSLDNSTPHNNDKNKGNKNQQSSVTAHWKVVIGVAAVLFILVGYLVDNSNEKYVKIKLLNDSIAQIQESISDSIPATTSSAVEGLEKVGASPASAETQSYDYSKMRINIKEKSKEEEGVKKDSTYSFEILDSKGRKVENDQQENVVWKVNGTTVLPTGYIVVNQIGDSLRITYSVNGKEEVTRTVQVIN